MAPIYYNYISVKDQLFSARQKSKCDFDFGVPKNVKGLHVNPEWTAQCLDPCTPGYCEVNIFIFIPSIGIPQTVNLIYVRNQPVAYIYFNPEILKILQKMEILDSTKLQIEKNTSKLLPSTLH